MEKKIHFFGKKHSDEALYKISLASRGRKHSEKSKKLMSDKRKGILSSSAKLNEIKALEIRKLYVSGLYSYRQIAEKYNVTAPLVGLVVRNELWVEQEYTYVCKKEYPKAKLTREEVEQIRKEYKNRKIKIIDLANKYNVSYNTICSIIKNKTWKTK